MDMLSGKARLLLLVATRTVWSMWVNSRGQVNCVRWSGRFDWCRRRAMAEYKGWLLAVKQIVAATKSGSRTLFGTHIHTLRDVFTALDKDNSGMYPPMFGVLCDRCCPPAHDISCQAQSISKSSSTVSRGSGLGSNVSTLADTAAPVWQTTV